MPARTPGSQRIRRREGGLPANEPFRDVQLRCNAVHIVGEAGDAPGAVEDLGTSEEDDPVNLTIAITVGSRGPDDLAPPQLVRHAPPSS